MSISTVFHSIWQQSKKVFSRHPLEITLITLFSVPSLFVNEIELNTFLGYALFFPIYFGVIYLTRRSRQLYWCSPFILAGMSAILIWRFGADPDIYIKRAEFWGVLLITFICFLSEGWHKNNQKYISLLIKKSVNLFILSGITGYLCFGVIYLLIGSVESLFSIEIFHNGFQANLWCFTTFGLIPLFFLLFEQKDIELNDFFEFIIHFIFSPVLILYSIILYLYLGKIALTMELPKGYVSYIVLPYLAAGIALSALQTILANPRWTRFYRLLPYIVPAPLTLLWFGIYERISSYGLTEMRIYLLSVTLTLTLFCLLSLWKRLLQYRYLAMIGIAAIFITTFLIHPKQIELHAQQAKLSAQLHKLGMLDAQGKIRADFALKTDIKHLDEKTGYQLNESARLAGHLYRLDHQIARHYGEQPFIELMNFYYDPTFAQAGDSWAGTTSTGYINFLLDRIALDLAGYKRIIFLRNPPFFPDNGALIFEGRQLTSLDIDQFIEQVMAKHNLAVDEYHSDDELRQLEQEFSLIETKEGTILLPQITICFDTHKARYTACEVNNIIFLEK